MAALAPETDSPGNRFRPCHRLLEAKDFKAVFEHRRVLRGRYFDLHVRPNGGETARIGFVVAKRLARRAVQRNLIKRFGRELFRRMRTGLPHLDLVLRLSKPVSGAAPGGPALREDIGDLLSRVPR